MLDDEFIAESIDPDTGKPVAEGELGDLVRLIRERDCACGRRGPMLMGGVSRLIG